MNKSLLSYFLLLAFVACTACQSSVSSSLVVDYDSYTEDLESLKIGRLQHNFVPKIHGTRPI